MYLREGMLGRVMARESGWGARLPAKWKIRPLDLCLEENSMNKIESRQKVITRFSRYNGKGSKDPRAYLKKGGSV